MPNQQKCQIYPTQIGILGLPNSIQNEFNFPFWSEKIRLIKIKNLRNMIFGQPTGSENKTLKRSKMSVKQFWSKILKNNGFGKFNQNKNKLCYKFALILVCKHGLIQSGLN